MGILVILALWLHEITAHFIRSVSSYKLNVIINDTRGHLREHLLSIGAFLAS